MVVKSNGKWHMFVDYIDFNRAYPKDSFPLPKIDQLVDSTVGNKLLSFMDAFLRYNQIMMHPANQDKTSFTRQSLYCYKVMSFSLKNAGATYQCLVNKLFKEQIGRSMKVYADDMISKVAAGKFLGFMLHERGIKANPKKIKAILDLESIATLKQAQGLTGKGPEASLLCKPCLDQIRKELYPPREAHLCTCDHGQEAPTLFLSPYSCGGHRPANETISPKTRCISVTFNLDSTTVLDLVPEKESKEWPTNCRAWILYMDGASNQSVTE
ncbi:hypothetical protein Q3G72_026615 [Acer saccharum]|nr:hypothetical protein Q3G72_026615 [Acer saccharum]